jgi:hypothetical protein
MAMIEPTTDVEACQHGSAHTDTGTQAKNKANKDM